MKFELELELDFFIFFLMSQMDAFKYSSARSYYLIYILVIHLIKQIWYQNRVNQNIFHGTVAKTLTYITHLPKLSNYNKNILGTFIAATKHFFPHTVKHLAVTKFLCIKIITSQYRDWDSKLNHIQFIIH